MSGGGGSTKSTTNTTAEPWEGVQPYLKDMYSDAQGLYDQGGPQYYPGQTFAPASGLEQMGQAQMLGYANNAMPQIFGNLTNAYSSASNATDVANNPYVNNMADTIQRRLGDNLTENIMPKIGRGAVAAGQFGGSRQGIMEGQAIEGTQQATGDALAQLYGDAYNTGLDAQVKSLGFGPSVMQAGLLPSAAMGNVGQWITGQNQQAIDADMMRFGYNQNLPYQNLDWLNSVYSGVPWGSSSTATGNNGGMSSGQQAASLAGGLLGYGLIGGPMGAMAGAMIPALF